MRKLAITVAAALLAAACSGDTSDTTDAGEDGQASGAIRDVSEQGEPVEGGSITVGLEAETAGWLPGKSIIANSGAMVALAVYDPLVRVDADGNAKPYLAESVEPNDDFTRWTVKLRPGIEFHDGTPLDAAAMKSVFDDYLTVPGSTLLGGLGGAEMEVVDDLTVAYVLPAPNSAFPYQLAAGAGWPFSPTAAKAAGDDAPSHPVGTGPFTFESWERDSRLVVRRNENYWQEGLPYLDEIVFRPIPDENTRVSSLATGDVDAVQSLREGTISELRELDGVDNYEDLGNNAGVNMFNVTKPPVDDIRVRRGLALALDQTQAIDVLGGTGMTEPATQLYNPDDRYYSETVAEDWFDYDPEAAAEELQSYVDDPERSDGKAPGTPISIRYDCPPDPSLSELSQLIQALWSAVGVDVELRQVDQQTTAIEALAGDYQVKCFRLGADTDPGLTLNNAFTEGSTTNFTRFTDPRVDEALLTIRATDDVEERKALVEEVMGIVNENVPLTYLGHTLGSVSVREEIKNVDGWTFPDGSEGGTSPQGVAFWSHVWTTG